MCLASAGCDLHSATRKHNHSKATPCEFRPHDAVCDTVVLFERSVYGIYDEFSSTAFKCTESEAEVSLTRQY